jgi:hypothetical protein
MWRDVTKILSLKGCDECVKNEARSVWKKDVCGNKKCVKISKVLQRENVLMRENACVKR